MPVNHTRLNLHDVMAILKRRGFAFHSQHGVGLRLTTSARGEKPFASGRRPRQLLIPISRQHLDEVLLMSRNEGEAAEVIERMSLGQMDAPQFGGPAQAPQMDSAQLDHLVTARVENALAQQARSQQARIGEVQAELERARAELADLKKQQSKPTRKKRASKKQAKKPAPSDELDPEEQKALDSVLAGEAAELAQLEDE